MDKFEACVFCGNRANAQHHLIFGRSLRRISDQDNLTIPVCDSCHTLGKARIHDNPIAEKLSKMLGQALWEKDYMMSDQQSAEVRLAFMERYGRSWL